MLILMQADIFKQKKIFRKRLFWSVCEAWNVINSDLPLAWWNMSFSSHPIVQGGHFCQNYYLFHNTLYSEKEKKKRHLHHLFWKIFQFGSVTPHLLNNLWDECITWFFLWGGTEEEKNNSFASLEEQHGIKWKRRHSDTFHLPPANTM